MYLSFEVDDSMDRAYIWNYTFDMTWAEIFYDLGPLMINEATDREIRESLNKSLRLRSELMREKDVGLIGYTNARNFQITEHDLQTIIIQLRAIGLITKSQKPRSIKDTSTYWTLMPYGDQMLTTLRAITKDDLVDDEDRESTVDGKEES